MEHPILRHLNSLVAAARTPRVGIAARAVGRVGALAAALGVGGVLGGAGVAVAETPDSSQAADSESRAASAGSSSRSAAAPGGIRSRAGEGSARASRQPSRATGAAAADSPAADRVRRGPLDVTAGAGRGATERAGGLAGSGDSAAANPAVPAAAPERVVTAPVAGSVGAPRAVTDPVPGGGAAALAGLPAAAAESVSAATAPTEVPTAAAPVASAASAALTPAPAAPAPASVLESVLGPLLGTGPLMPIESPVSLLMLAAARRLGVSDPGEAVVAPTAAAAVLPGRTTTITWAWGTDTVLDFDPTADRLDFGWFQPNNFDISELEGSTRIGIAGNNQSYTLDGVALGQLSTDNIIANEATTLTKWRDAIEAAGPVTQPPVVTPPADPSPPDTTVPDTTVPDTSAPDTTAPDTGTPDTSVPDTTAPDTSAPDTTAPDTGTPATAARWGETFFAPYVDMGGWPVPDLVAISEATGTTLFTAAFLQATPDGKAAWAGIPALEPGSGNEQVENINRSITSLQDAGGDVMVSLGGAAGTSLAQYYHARGLGAQELAEAYAGVVDTYRISHLDFDIEGAAVAEPASIALHSQALKLLQDSKPDLQVWYTLPVLPTGLTADGLNVVDSALNAGVDLAGVNVMAMDYGESAAPTSGPNAKTMGAYAIEAAESTHDQLTTLYAGYGKTYDFSQLGVTPMIGVNDVLSEVFTVADAQALEDFARANGLGMLSMWSVTRDNPGTFGQATPIASGLDAPAGSFAGVFADYGTQNTVEASTPGGTPGGGTLEPGGTTTTITWSWGSDTVLDFDPATDRLDFGWFQPTNFDIGEQAGSTRIAIVGNDQSYTLDGVALDALSTANIIALDANTLAKWQNAVGGTATTPPAVTPPAEPAEPSEPEVVTPPAEPAEPTEPEVVTPPVVDDTPDTGDGGAPATGGTTTVITWKWGTDTVLAFDPVTDRLDFGWFQPTNFDIGEQAGSTRIAIVGNDQSYTLDGVALDALSTANIIALDANTLAKWQNAVGGTATTPPAVTPPAEPATPEDTTPDTTTPDSTVPDTTVPDTTVPDTTVPDTTTPPVVNPPAAGGDVDPAQSALAIAAHDKVLAAYFPEWGIYGRDFQIADIPAEQLTHVIYSFLNLTSNGDVVLYDSYAAVDKRFSAAETVSGEADQWYYPPGDPRAEQTVWGNFNQLAQLKEQYPHLKVSAAIGGWTLSGNFSDVAATAAGRERMTDSIVDFLQTYQMFDGVDFDWEYPGGGGLASNSVSPQDGENYAALLATLRQKLDVLEQQTGREYEISVAAPGGYDKIANFNAAGLAPSVDFFNLMSYDFHGTWESTTGHQSALTADPDGYDIANAVGLYLAAGVDPSKIVIGAPLYTRAWSGVADGGDGGYLETASGKAPGSFEAGVYDYKDLLAQVQDPASGWKLYWDDNAQAAYVYNASEGLFSSFETPTSIAQKAQWADDLGLGGMMFWDISNDAVGSPEGLVNAAYQSWVLDRDLTEIRGDSSLTGEVVVGGDGAITALPNSINL